MFSGINYWKFNISNENHFIKLETFYGSPVVAAFTSYDILSLYLITKDSSYTTQKLGSFLFTDELTHLEWKLLPIDTPLKLIDTEFTHYNIITYIIKDQFYWSYFNFTQINMNPSLPRQSNAYFFGCHSN